MSAPDIDVFAPFRLDGKVAVITGASSGIGERLARVLAIAGATVVAAARRAERLDALAKDEPFLHPFACDITDDADCARLIDSTITEHGGIDILVNNAGITNIVPAEEEGLEGFRQVVETNLVAAFNLSKRAAAHMLGFGSGTIVNVASVLGVVGNGQITQASYAATKGAMVNLTRELAAQWARRGIRVNALCPGWFPSEMTADMFGDERSEAWIRRNTPMGRAGRLEELDGALLFLASDASSYVTGQALAVDGGWLAV